MRFGVLIGDLSCFYIVIIVVCEMIDLVEVCIMILDLIGFFFFGIEFIIFL